MNFLSKLFLTCTIIFTAIACDDLLNEKDDKEGSGNVIMIEKSFINFSELNFANAIEVDVFQADSYSVKIWIDDNLENDLITQKGRNNLTIELNDDNNYRNYTFKARITMPDLVSIQMSGASDLELYDIENPHDMSIDLSGASRVNGEIITDDIKIELSGASFIELVGEADDLEIDASGASVLNLGEFNVNDVNINLSGASVATIFANIVIDAVLSGASVLNWKGEAQIRNITSTGASVITHIPSP
jgi:hypothetical protein